MLHGVLEVSFMGEPSPGDARSRDANLGAFLEKFAKKRKTITCNSGVCFFKSWKAKTTQTNRPKVHGKTSVVVEPYLSAHAKRTLQLCRQV